LSGKAFGLNFWVIFVVEMKAIVVDGISCWGNCPSKLVEED
jgi:hypothetical protein